jgi:hypothetical protein
MAFKADLRCMMCGHFVGEVTAVREGRVTQLRGFTPGPHFHGFPDQAPRQCDKCGGSLMFDEVEQLAA